MSHDTFISLLRLHPPPRPLSHLSTTTPTVVAMFTTLSPEHNLAPLIPVPLTLSRKGSNASIASIASLLSFRGEDDEIVTVDGLPHAHRRLAARWELSFIIKNVAWVGYTPLIANGSHAAGLVLVCRHQYSLYPRYGANLFDFQ
jgi:hypothetical protein